jgi:hypothetical protein
LASNPVICLIPNTQQVPYRFADLVSEIDHVDAYITDIWEKIARSDKHKALIYTKIAKSDKHNADSLDKITKADKHKAVVEGQQLQIGRVIRRSARQDRQIRHVKTRFRLVFCTMTPFKKLEFFSNFGYARADESSGYRVAASKRSF